MTDTEDLETLTRRTNGNVRLDYRIEDDGWEATIFGYINESHGTGKTATDALADAMRAHCRLSEEDAAALRKAGDEFLDGMESPTEDDDA
jgi:predicted lipoprotein